MANRWCDGFGRYGGTKARMLNGSSSQAWAQVDADWTLSSANPRTGSWALRLADSVAGGEVRRVFGAPLEEAYFGHAINCSQLPNQEPDPDAVISPRGLFLASFRDAANNPQVSFWLGTDGAIVVYRGGVLEGSGDFVGALLGRTVPVIGAGAYQHVEYFVKTHNSSGAIEVRVDQVTRLNLTGIDTQTTANQESSQVAVGHLGLFLLDGGHMDMADCFVNDTVDDGSACNDFIGDVKSGDLPPDADTAQADFALSSGSVGYSLISERPPNDTTGLSTSSATARSDFGIAAPPANTTEILCARPWIRASKDDAGTCLMAPNLKSGSATGDVDAQPIATAPAYYDSLVAYNPDGDIPWTQSTLGAAQLVVERTA